MSTSLEIRDSAPGGITVGLAGGADLWHYAFAPTTPAEQSPRPYLHPVYSLDGDVLTNWRPNDHPWHQGLSFTLTSVAGVNFWGGPSHRAEDGYQWRRDQGVQRHREWILQTPERMVETLDWCDPQQDDRVVLTEERTLITELVDGGWRLRWVSQLHNPGDHDLRCDNYHSMGGLEGSHYTGLQFRGARGLLDQHGDDSIRVVGENGATALKEVHGVMAKRVDWHVQHDGSLRRSRIRFESGGDSIPWFVRPSDPMVAFSPHRETAWNIPARQTVVLNHLLTFTRE